MAVARTNSICMDDIDCVSDTVSSAGSNYSLAIVTPVLTSGRLDQDVILSLGSVKETLVPNTGLLLPHCVELWTVAVGSELLAVNSHLCSDDNVLGFKIADQVGAITSVYFRNGNIF